MKPTMPSSHLFKNVALTDQHGRAFQLQRAEISPGDDKRRPVRLKLFARSKGNAEAAALVTIELSQREAYAFSEWLDRAVTQPRPE